MKARSWRTTLLASLLCLSPLAHAQDVLWRDILQKDSETTTARHEVLLTGGDLIVGGAAGAANRDFLVYRINGTTGAVVWSRRIDGGGTSESINDIIADPATGDAYFCGRTSATGQSLNWYVMKINGADGTNAWAAPYTFNHTQNGNDESRSLAFVQDGASTNIVVAGLISTTAGNGGRVIKLNAGTGALLWGVNYETVFRDYRKVVTASNGDIYAVGMTTVDGFQNAGWVTKLNVAGTQLWSISSAGPGAVNGHYFTNAAIEPGTSDLIATGYAQGSGNNNDISVARFQSSNGARLWHTLFNSPVNGADIGQALALDATHAYISTGDYAMATGTDWFIAKLSLDNGLYDSGNGGWTATFGGDDAASTESLSNLKVVGTTVYAAGVTRYLVPGRVLTTLKLSAATGAVINRTNFTDRIGIQTQGLKAMQVASNGDMLIAGDSGAQIGFAEVGRFGSASTVSDANLSAMTISAGTLAPVFSSSQQAYSASVGNTTSSLTVTPTVAISGATVRVNGNLVTSGNASAAINLAVGLNDIRVVVTATDTTTTKTYLITINRDVCAACPRPWGQVEAVGGSEMPFSSMARNASDQVYAVWIKGSQATAQFKLLRYDNPGPTATWTHIGGFQRGDVPNVDLIEDEVSLAIDGTGRFHIAFRGRRNTTSGAWYGTSATGAAGTWSFTELVTFNDPNGLKGLIDVVIKTDPSNRPHVSYVYTDFNAPREEKLRLLSYNGTAWVANDNIYTTSGGSEINVPDLDIDSAGKVHIVFEAETNGSGTDGSLMYVNNTTGSFPAPTVLATGATSQQQGRSISMLRDAADKIHIVRNDYLNRLYYHTNASGSFTSAQINGSLVGGVKPDSISRNANGDLFIVYRNTGIDVHYAYLPGGIGTTWLTGMLYRGNSATAGRFSGIISNYRYGFSLFDHRPTGPNGQQELWNAVQELPAPEIAVEQPVNTGITDGGSQGFGNVNLGSNASLTFTIRNSGEAVLAVSVISIDGTNAADFSVTAAPATSVTAAGGTTTFTLRFTPGAVGARSAAIHIANSDSSENPYDISVSGTGVNTAPVITPASALSRQRGSNASAVTVATVSDAETTAGNLVVTAPTVPAGITVGSIVNTTGTVSAVVTASCTATLGANTVVLRVADAASATTDGNLTVNVSADNAPLLGYSAQSALSGGTLTVNPSTALSDNGSVTNVIVQSQGTYTGTISVNASGVVSLGAIAPSGTHAITIRATDNCGTATDASFTLAVNALPTVTVTTGLNRQRGSAATTATLGTVADQETAAGSLVVNASPPSGIVVGTLANAAGTVTAPLSASCTATLGNNTLVLTATDGAGSSTNGNVIVAVTANSAPTLGYTNQIVAPGAALTINPSTTLADNGTISNVQVLSQGAYTGSISVNASGVISIVGAAPAGAHTITIRATDNCNTNTDASVELLVNTPPTITAATPSLRQGSPAALTTLATVADGESAAGTLAVSTTSLPPGITLTGLANSNGTVQANLSADCSATIGVNPVGLNVSDGRQSGSTNVSVDVLANTAPVLAYTAQAVVSGGSLFANPSTALSDNGSVSTVIVQSQGTYTGTISVDGSGVVSISAAAPSGTHTITIRATDNCGTATDASFTLAVNALPTVTVTTGLNRQRGSAATTATLGTVADQETAAGSLVINASPPSGIVVGTLANTAGTVTASLSASCTATLGSNTVVLSATDAAGSSANGNVLVAVTANTPPTLGYANQIVAPGAAITITPSIALGDNGDGPTVIVQSPGSYTGTITVDASGVVSISGAAPPGAHTISLRATDNCGTTTDASFELLVNTPPTITAATPSLRQGSPAALTTLATVADGESAAGTLAVSTTSLPPGITLTGLANSNGTVQATLTAACDATTGANSIGVDVSDGRQGASVNVAVDVLANTAPTVAYAAQTLPLNGSALINPVSGPGDNGSITSIVLPSLGSYTGVASIDTQGRITLANAAPVGNHTLTVRLVDNCGMVNDQTFAVAVTRSITALQLSSNVSPSRFGQAVTLTADLAGLAPTGAIEFLADNVSLGSTPLTGTGDTRAAVLIAANLAVGNPVLKARYAGDTTNAPAEFELFTQLVQAATTRTTLTPDNNPGAPGSRTITAQVQPNAPGGGVPAGSVSISSGAANCVATLVAGSGSCALDLTTPGYKTISASYTPANGNHGASSASGSIVIADASSSADVRVRIGNGRSYIEAGSALSYQITLDNLGPNAAVARLQAPIANGLIGASFQCLRAGPAQCGVLNGNGAIDTLVNLGPGGVVLYTITATAPLAPEDTIVQSASVSLLAPTTDPDLGNNFAADVDPMGLFIHSFEDANADE